VVETFGTPSLILNYLSAANPVNCERQASRLNFRRIAPRQRGLGVEFLTKPKDVEMKTLERLLVAFALCLIPAHAGVILYSDSGTFSSSTPSSEYSGPSTSWAFSFQADINPTVLSFGNGGFDFAFSDFTYFLNGSPVGIVPTSIRFFTAANGGGFFICLGAQPCGNGVFPNGLGTGFSAPQLYSGSNSAPTLLPGPFTSLPFNVVVNSITYGQANTTLQATAPEPSTFVVLAVGLLALVGRRVDSRRERQLH
jgi:hypothetical protein